MIKTTKNNVANILKNRLKDMLVVKHVCEDSHDADLTVWNRHRNFLSDNMLFLDVSSDYRYFIIRNKWNYDGIAKKFIPEAQMEDIIKDIYYPIEIEDFDLPQEMSSLRDEIMERINIVIHIINFMTINKTKGVMYEIYCYMKEVIEDYERLLKLNIL